mgnify:CR=1 FL=1
MAAAHILCKPYWILILYTIHTYIHSSDNIVYFQIGKCIGMHRVPPNQKYNRTDGNIGAAPISLSTKWQKANLSFLVWTFSLDIIPKVNRGSFLTKITKNCQRFGDLISAFSMKWECQSFWHIFWRFSKWQKNHILPFPRTSR